MQKPLKALWIKKYCESKFGGGVRGKRERLESVAAPGKYAAAEIKVAKSAHSGVFAGAESGSHHRRYFQVIFLAKSGRERQK